MIMCKHGIDVSDFCAQCGTRQQQVARRIRQTNAVHVKVEVELESPDGTRRAYTVCLPAEVEKLDLRELLIEKLEAAVGSLERLEARA